MSEICVKCWSKRYGKQSAQQYILSRELDFCETCGEYHRVIVRMKTRYLLKEWLCDWISYLRSRQ